MPRRKQLHPLVVRLGQRFRELRKEKGYSLEQVTYGSGLNGKGFMSDFENGYALPSAISLLHLAEFLEVDLLDVLNVVERGPRNQLAEMTRDLGESELKALLDKAHALGAERETADTDRAQKK
jgi:transcriptional regulator with XRE-family HTH domain